MGRSIVWVLVALIVIAGLAWLALSGLAHVLWFLVRAALIVALVLFVLIGLRKLFTPRDR